MINCQTFSLELSNVLLLSSFAHSLHHRILVHYCSSIQSLLPSQVTTSWGQNRPLTIKKKSEDSGLSATNILQE